MTLPRREDVGRWMADAQREPGAKDLAMVDRIIEFVERRWGAVVLAGALVGALFGLIANARAPETHVARTLVVLTEANIPPEEFADVARAMFPTDAVLRPVIRDLGLDRTPAQLIADGTVGLEPQPGGLAVVVVARTSGPDLAVQIANAAAAQLADVSQTNGIGSLAEFPADGPATRAANPPLRAIAVGALIGALIAALDVGIILALRRRTLGAIGAHRFDVALRVRVRPPASEGESPTVESAFPLRNVLPDAGAGTAVGSLVQPARDEWAMLAVAERLGQEGSGPLALVAPTDLPEDVSGVVVIAESHTPGSRLRSLRRALRERSDAIPTALLLVHVVDEG